MKENDLHRFHVKCVDQKNHSQCAEITTQHTLTAKNYQRLHLIRPLQAEKRGERVREREEKKLFSSKFITAQSENRMRPELTSGMQIRELLTWINLLEHYRARVLIIQWSPENGDKHCHLFLHGVPTHSENDTWFIGRERSQIFTMLCRAADT